MYGIIYGLAVDGNISSVAIRLAAKAQLGFYV